MDLEIRVWVREIGVGISGMVRRGICRGMVGGVYGKRKNFR